MPLKKSTNQKNISDNIRKLTEENNKRKKKRSKKQIIAIAMNVGKK